MVELIKDERHVVKKGKEYIFTHNNKQKYTKEQVKNMLKSWEEENKKLQEFIDNYDKIYKTTMDDIKAQYDNMVKKVNDDLQLRKSRSISQIKYNKEAIELWSNPE